jgi:hypothetical protein
MRGVAIALACALSATHSVGCSSRGEDAPPSPAPPKAPSKVAAAPKPAAVAPATIGPRPTADEEAVLAMYDAIAVAFEKHPGDCDAMGGELDAIVDRSTPDVKRWADAQSGLDATQRALAGDRLQAVAGPRIERAQTSMRLAMGACPDSARFQAALAKLTALTPES